MNRFQIILSILILIGFTSCNMDTKASRKSISQQTKQLADVVRASPNSTAAREALLELTNIAKSDWNFGATQAIISLGNLGPLAKEAIPTLEAIVQRNEKYTCPEAIRALGRIGPDAASSVDMLITELRKGGYNHSSMYAAEALGNIGEAALPALPDLMTAAKSEVKPLARFANEAIVRLKQIRDPKQDVNASP